MCIMKQQETIKAFFLKGAIKANYGKGAALKADADRDGRIWFMWIKWVHSLI